MHARTVRGTGVAHEAVSSGRLELIKWIAKRRPSLLDVATQDGKTPLHVAALHGHLDACKLLLDNGARINALLRTSKGALMTALDAALYRAHRDCAKLVQLHGGVTAQHLKANKNGGPAKGYINYTFLPGKEFFIMDLRMFWYYSVLHEIASTTHGEQFGFGIERCESTSTTSKTSQRSGYVL